MDLNGNGRKDIVSGSWPGEIYLFPRRPNGTYGSAKPIRYATGSKIKVGSATAVAVSDWNQDQLPDLVVGDIGGFVHLIRNSGSTKKPAFQRATKLKAGGRIIKASGGDAGPAVADWDNDGLQDLLVGSGKGEVWWYRNTRSATDPELAAGTLLIQPDSTPSDNPDAFDHPTGSRTRTKISIADWNQDGLQDLIVGDFSSTRVGTTSKYHGWVWVYLRKPESAAEPPDLN